MSSSPSGDNDLSGGLLLAGWKGDGPNVIVEVEFGGNGKDGNIISEGPSVVVFVSNDAGDLASLFKTTVIQPVEVPSDDGVRTGASRVDTMSSSDDDLLSLHDYKGPTADVTTAVTERDLVWEFTLLSILSSDNSVRVDLPLDLGKG